MHVKRVELSHFKSFGGTTQVPLLPGFTVISGPNGSGKSNILDALLFCLGLASSKGMRAERLPDLVNQNQASRRSTSEASVTATFDISDVSAELLSGDDDTPTATELPSQGDNDADLESDAASEGDEPSVHNTQNDDLPISSDADATSSAAPSADPSSSPAATALDNVVPLPREWSVTRRLRVTAQGTYTSNYFIDGQPCTLTELHEQLQRFRIYPEGYNVVLQGDVTSIISMKSRERREIIDELAGVASFDRKIDQAKLKLDLVRDREDRFRIVERELIDQLERLDQDRKKAEKYKQLKATLQEKIQWQAVLEWRQQQQQARQLEDHIAQGKEQAAKLAQQRDALVALIETTAKELDELNTKVKALGEDEHLALQSKLATQEAELRQLERQEQTLRQSTRELAAKLQATQVELQQQSQELTVLGQRLATLSGTEIMQLQTARDRAAQAVEESREATSAIATASQAWVETQTTLRREVEALLGVLEPQRSEHVRLQERLNQLQSQIATQTTVIQGLEAELAEAPAQEESELSTAKVTIQTLAQAVATAEQELKIQRQTRERLLQELREKQRELDKLEAQEQALQETHGTQATQVLVRNGLTGICGLVAQLGRVDPKYQTALEIAAGARLGYLVVENDGVASRGIDILKRQRAGRATFLPLNAIRAPRTQKVGRWERPDGFIDYAVDLIECDDIYREVFAFVFGNTVVFERLNDARRHLGKFRMVTLDGEVLESSGAMTGGSLRRQGRLHFGTVEAGESAEAKALRERLQEIERILGCCDRALAQADTTVKTQSKALIEARQSYREQQLQNTQAQQQCQQLQQRLAKAQQQQQQYQTEYTTAQQRLQTLEISLPAQETQLQQKRQELTALEESQTHSEWQQAQGKVRALELELTTCQQALQTAQQRQNEMEAQQQRLQEKIQVGQQTMGQGRQQQQQQIGQQTELNQQQATLKQEIIATQAALTELDKTLAGEKAERDRKEHQLRDQRNQLQQLEWQQQKLSETQQGRQQQLVELQHSIEVKQAELPDPLPEVPADLTLETLQKQLKSLQRRLEAMEPVNMLALEEYERTQERLEELTNKLTTLEEERTELLLRIENFTTLRCQAFREAFDAVNKNFQSIFAELSDGDGYLQLDDPQDPFNGGLNLVAHPKGKPVRRLASMSGGEKSLTALSFIFALQRYRPSPFYAFDEVDMFLDGANVERLSKMIRHQAQQAQFIVVSLRRPMIESAERTIGVTQARGAYTQVLGINLQRASAGG
ncbi:chromosome segregation protein SMC [Leptolyngbya cf. ectocarpi LEGE 11479]|uniref:Chromosome partition protein Smc n=1 Tax=Leptolyngbya cf. ectocarpi LEGE 11479 TaxID=1828722 RepID=A0A928X1D3_LEPEC|nr:chromosome segregation protein SMC [Leptolyngbya ectocarpi]MBE9065596.1 chromosome segregation protein SMC [Leptolyngbya cf. ectocarpi LEGE 11479]